MNSLENKKKFSVVDYSRHFRKSAVFEVFKRIYVDVLALFKRSFNYLRMRRESKVRSQMKGCQLVGEKTTNEEIVALFFDQKKVQLSFSALSYRLHKSRDAFVWLVIDINFVYFLYVLRIYICDD